MDVRRHLEQLSRDDARSKVFNQALEQLVKGATVQFPEEMIQDMLSDLLKEFEAERLRPEGVTLKDFLTMTGRTEDELRQMLRQTAIERLKAMLVLSAFAASEQIKIAPEEIEAEIDRRSEEFGEHAQVFRRLLASKAVREQIGSTLFSRRTTDRLVAIARGEVPATPAEGETEADVEEGAADTPAVAEAVQQSEEEASPTEAAEEKQD
jgi:trigger factor